MAMRPARLGIGREIGSATKESMLSRWYTGGYQDIAQSKRGDMDKNGLEVILVQATYSQ